MYIAYAAFGRQTQHRRDVVYHQKKRSLEFKNAKRIFPPGNYEKYIHSHFIADHIGIELESIGKKDFEKKVKIDLNSNLIDPEYLENEISDLIKFIRSKKASRYDELLWYRINVIDQAVNDYKGVGLMNKETKFINFIVESLNYDRADQSGDAIFTIFDLDFNWAVNFTLSQDFEHLEIEKYNSEEYSNKNINHAL